MIIRKVKTIADAISVSARLALPHSDLNAKKCYVFCEDKITLNIERALAKLSGMGFFNIEVLTFKRYIKSRKSEINMLDKESSGMAIRKIISELSGELTCFKKCKIALDFPETLYELISQLESAKVTSKDLLKIIESDFDAVPKALLMKLKDVFRVYERYEAYLAENGFVDSNAYLSLMPDLIRGDDELKNSAVILSGFPSVTKQRYEIFKALFDSVADLTAIVLAGDEKDVYTLETLNALKNIDKTAEIVEEPTSLTPDARKILSVLYNPDEIFKRKTAPKEALNSVTIAEFLSAEKEAEFAAKAALKEVRGGKRFKDIAVAVGDGNAYFPLIEKYFQDYGVPYYLDRPFNLSDHFIAKFVSDYIDLCRRGFLRKDYLSFVSSLAFCTDKNKTDALKNYVLKKSLNRKRLADAGFEDEELASLHKKVISACENFKNAKTVKELNAAVLTMLDKIGAQKNVLDVSDKLESFNYLDFKEFNDKVFESVVNLLSEVERVIGDKKISPLEYKNVFLSGAESLKISGIPVYSDAVYVADASEVKLTAPKTLIAIGLSSGVPSVKNDVALLTDKDLEKLDELKVSVDPKIKAVNKRGREAFVTSLCSYKEKLILSCPSVSAGGKAAIKSDFIKTVSDLFKVNKISEAEDFMLARAGAYNALSDRFLAEKPAMREIANLKQSYVSGAKYATVAAASFFEAAAKLNGGKVYEKAAEILNGESFNELSEYLGEEAANFHDNEISATAIESYFSCPYLNYAKNLLKLAPAETGEIRVNDVGTFLHGVIEYYVKNVSEVSDKTSSDALAEKAVEHEYSSGNYESYGADKKGEFYFEMLLKEAKRVCYVVYLGIEGSDFKPSMIEQSFGGNSPVPPVTLHSESGDYFVRGKVDRVDRFGNNVRIIDYKSGKIEDGLDKFYCGSRLQLYLYMNAFLSGGDKPAGAYYFPVRDGYAEEASGSDAVNYKMSGKTVLDDVILNATDKCLKANKKSEFVKIRLKNCGEPYADSQVVTEGEMEAFLKYSVKIAERGVNELKKGYVRPSPYDGKCKYCEYGAMCRYDVTTSGERKIKNVSEEDIVKAAAEDSNGAFELTVIKPNDGGSENE